MCKEPGCDNRPRCGIRNGEYCIKHKKPSRVNVNKCKEPRCDINPIYGYENREYYGVK